MIILENEINKLRLDVYYLFDNKPFYLWAFEDKAFSFKKKKWTDESLSLVEYNFIWYEKTVKQS